MRHYSILFLFAYFNCFSQLETSKWHFGAFGALDFQSGSPLFINNSANNSFWCTGSIADSLGNQLFYSDGEKIWNKNNVLMANGTVIGGHWAGSQNALIIRKSGAKYYVFLTNMAQTVGSMINYAVVDMSLAGGLGSVTASYLPVSPHNQRMASKLAGTKHCNKKDYWVLTHAAATNTVGSQSFYAYHVTKDSINRTAVVSNLGVGQTWLSHSGSFVSGRGILKFSPNGKKVCSTYNPNCVVEIYDFDNATGVLSNPVQLESIPTTSAASTYSDPACFGVEFSPDGSKLYISYVYQRPAICQYNLCAGSSSAIISSKTIIRNDTFPMLSTQYAIDEVRSFQTALDGKIYVTDNTLQSVGVISNPNAAGTSCNYSTQAIGLGTNTIINTPAYCQRGFPTFISNYFEQKPTLSPQTSSVSCGNAAFSPPSLCAFAGYSATAYHWNFGDVLSGSSNTSSAVSPNHVFSANGTYTFSLILQYSCGADTLKNSISISGLPTLSISGKTTLCKGENLQFNFSGANSYSINSVAIAQSSVVLQPSVSSTYTLIGFDPNTGCKSLKVFTITVNNCSGISTINEGLSSITIYPNPTKGVFSIDLNENAEIKITDLSGRTVFEESLQKGIQEIDLSNYTNGLYLLHAKNNNFERTIKLVKD